MQIDWGHFGHLQIGRARRPLMAFVVVLSYSRRVFVHFSLNARMDAFLQGHALAFAAWGGLARVALYDNLKSAVLERVGDAIRFNPELLAFASHYRYEPRPVAVARGNEKGRVERKIRFIRDSFFAAREFTDVDDLNAQARVWCEGQAGDLRWPEDTRVSVREAFEIERASLLALPQADYPVHERLEVQVAKTPYVRFDLNDYSVPHEYVRRTLTVVATPGQVRILDGPTELANHARCYDSAQQIEVAAHIQALVSHKRASRQHRATDALAQAAPAATELLQRAAARGHNLGSITATLSRLLERYGAQALQAAIIEALAHDVPHPNAVRLALERAREARQENPPVLAQLSERARQLDVTVRPHALNSYDDLSPGKDADDHQTPDDEDIP